MCIEGFQDGLVIVVMWLHHQILFSNSFLLQLFFQEITSQNINLQKNKDNGVNRAINDWNSGRERFKYRHINLCYFIHESNRFESERKWDDSYERIANFLSRIYLFICYVATRKFARIHTAVFFTWLLCFIKLIYINLKIMMSHFTIY